MRTQIRSILDQKYHSKMTTYVEKNLRKLSYSNAAQLARQFMPSSLELVSNQEYIKDPLYEEDKDISPFPFVVHKYINKLLILTTNRCPVYCRYCTRKRKTLSKGAAFNEINWGHLKKYIQDNPRINEIILSGGDPLVLSNKRLELLAERCLEEKSILFIRYHTRMPTTDPKRFSPDLYSVFKRLIIKFPNKISTFVFHINHPQELTKESFEIFQRLRDMGYHLLSQSVLLRRVNDHPDILARLFKKLFLMNVRPYYLHQLDKVEGASHFYVPVKRGIDLLNEVKTRIPPYMIPSYVEDSKYGKKKIIF